MQINNIQNIQFGINPKTQNQQTAKTVGSDFVCKDVVKPDVSSIRANFAPNINFTGNAPQIKNAYIITGEEKDVPLLVTKKNESFVIDFDSQTEVIYGIDAVNYLDSVDEFEYDTQVIFPRKAQGTLLVDDKEVPLPENSAVMINAGAKTKVKVDKGYPLMLITKKDYDWYERYGRHAQDSNIKNKFLELIYYNSHLYNGEFTPNIMLSEQLRDEKFLSSIGIQKYQSKNNLVYDLFNKKDSLPEDKRIEVEQLKALLDKMYSTGVVEARDDGYIRFKNMRKPEMQVQVFEEKGFTKEEIQKMLPIYKQTRQAKLDSKFALKNPTTAFSPELIEKMKKTGFLHNAKKENGFVYWKDIFGNENTLRRKLYEAGFNKDEENRVVESWKQANLTGFDISGLKFINKDLAVYNLNDKLNNWTHEKTNWVTNSTALTSTDEKTPFVGVSMVQYDDDGAIEMSKIRSEEKLHAHPNLEEKRQTEIYVISSGAAALNVVKGGKSRVQILKEGDLAVVGPGVMHCINSILGEYEHIVAQVPSAFQYGYGFKAIVDPPEDYDMKALELQALHELAEYKKD